MGKKLIRGESISAKSFKLKQTLTSLALVGIFMIAASFKIRAEELLSAPVELLSFRSASKPVDFTGKTDSSAALSAAVEAVNARSAFVKNGRPPQATCIHIPAGIFRIDKAPPSFKGAGCIVGEGSASSILRLSPTFSGDLFAWSEAWIVYSTSGPTVRHLRIEGSTEATHPQNALMFYDRNDNVNLEDIYIENLPGRAIGTGLLKPYDSAGQAYIRESHFRSIRVFRSGTLDLPAVEFSTQGTGNEDGTNEISASQIDIFGSLGPGMVIRNSSQKGVVRDIKFDALRIEGSDSGGPSRGDLLQIGDPGMIGGVGHLSFTSLELIDPPPNYAAVRITSGAPPGDGPTRIMMQGYIGGGLSKGEGLRIENGSTIQVHFNQIKTEGTNVVIGPGVKNILLDGGGMEDGWTYAIASSSEQEITAPVRRIVPSKKTP